MELVKNEEKYWEFIRQLRNMDGVKQGFIEQDHIQKQAHSDYMKKNSNFFYICLDKSSPIGYIGIIDLDIRVATHPDHQGKGVGSFMLNELMKRHPSAVAKIKINNHASIRLFEKCGFKKKYYLLERE